MLSTVKNKQLINIYRNYVELFYHEREISNTVGSFIVNEEKTSYGASELSEGNAEKNKKKMTSHPNILGHFLLLSQKQ